MGIFKKKHQKEMFGQGYCLQAAEHWWDSLEKDDVDVECPYQELLWDVKWQLKGSYYP